MYFMPPAAGAVEEPLRLASDGQRHARAIYIPAYQCRCPRSRFLQSQSNFRLAQFSRFQMLSAICLSHLLRKKLSLAYGLEYDAHLPLRMKERSSALQLTRESVHFNAHDVSAQPRVTKMGE